MLIYRKFARDQKNILIIKSTVNILQIHISMKKPNWKEERMKNSEKRNLRLCIAVKILNYPKKKKKENFTNEFFNVQERDFNVQFKKDRGIIFQLKDANILALCVLVRPSGSVQQSERFECGENTESRM